MPSDVLQPILFQFVDDIYVNIGNIRPRLIGEGIVVEEFVRQQKRDRKVPVESFGTQERS